MNIVSATDSASRSPGSLDSDGADAGSADGSASGSSASGSSASGSSVEAHSSEPRSRVLSRVGASPTNSGSPLAKVTQHPSAFQAHEVELKEQELTAYLSELAHEGRDVAVRVKDGPASPARPLGRLHELHRLLLEKRIWGAQVSHRVGRMKIIDTLMVHQGGIQRIRSKA